MREEFSCLDPPSSRSIERFLQPIAIAPAHSESRAIFQSQQTITIRKRLHLRNSVEPHNRRAMDPDKCRGVEPPLQDVQRLTEQMRLPVDVQRRIIALRLDPFDFVRGNKEDAATVANREPLRIS